MKLHDALNMAHLFRPLGVPANPANICVISMHGDLGRIGEMLQLHPNLKPRALIIPDLPAQTALNLRIELDGEKLPVHEFAWLGECPQLEKIFICPQDPVILASILSEMGRFLASMAVENIWLFGKETPAHSIRPAYPDFFAENRDALEHACGLFDDQGSREVFIGRLKALLAGNSAYIPIASHREYFHPLVHPESGDIMIDGGVSDMVGMQKEFARAVGERGQIFGFEPIPSMAESAGRQLAGLSSYHLQCAGLARESGEAVFDDLRDSSRISSSADMKPGQVRCQLTSIDEFCAKNHLGRINCIKLDVEGAELDALKGAEKTIRRCMPRLIVCLYHKPVDMYEIPLWIKETAPDYRLYLAHSSCQFMDTILYAIKG